MIETERLILRKLVMSDDAGMFELDSNRDVHTYLGNNTLNTIDQSRKAISKIQEQYQNNGIGRWAMIEKETNHFLGWAGLKFIDEKINNHIHYYDVGYRLIKRYWGKGFATEAAMASVHYGLTILNQNTIYGMADSQNVASIHVLQKIGLKPIEEFIYATRSHLWFKTSKNDID
jgi:ribosomal-protein-alanine N-acetyltransferase